MENVLKIKTNKAFRNWLSKNHDKEKECYVLVKKGEPVDHKTFWYIDAVETALCFGWIDSTLRDIGGVKYQRFGPRKKKSLWTEQNKERVRRLEKLGLMTDAGRKVLPDMRVNNYKLDKDVERALKKAKALETFNSFPSLYKRVRLYNLAFYKKLNKDKFNNILSHFVKETAKGKMYGMWNDYGRLIDY